MAAPGHSMVSANLLRPGRRLVWCAGAPRRSGARQPRPPSCLCAAPSFLSLRSDLCQFCTPREVRAQQNRRAGDRRSAGRSGRPAGSQQGQYPQNWHHPAAVASVRRGEALGLRFLKRAVPAWPRRQRSPGLSASPPRGCGLSACGDVYQAPRTCCQQRAVLDCASS